MTSRRLIPFVWFTHSHFNTPRWFWHQFGTTMKRLSHKMISREKPKVKRERNCFSETKDKVSKTISMIVRSEKGFEEKMANFFLFGRIILTARKKLTCLIA